MFSFETGMEGFPKTRDPKGNKILLKLEKWKKAVSPARQVVSFGLRTGGLKALTFLSLPLPQRSSKLSSLDKVCSTYQSGFLKQFLSSSALFLIVLFFLSKAFNIWCKLHSAVR